jgi:hypothetical protein
MEGREISASHDQQANIKELRIGKQELKSFVDYSHRNQLGISRIDSLSILGQAPYRGTDTSLRNSYEDYRDGFLRKVGYCTPNEKSQ